MNEWRELPGQAKQRLAERLEAEIRERRRALWVPYPWQIPPDNIPAHGTWLQLGGRGTGKTDSAARYTAEHVRGPACDPRIPGGHRVAIVAPTLGDAAESCVNGPSGLRAHDPSVALRHTVGGSYVKWPSGAEAKLFGAHTPDDIERLRSGGNRCVSKGSLVQTETGSRPVEDVRPGDRVWTRNGLRDVLRAGPTGQRELWRVHAGRTTLLLTGDHEVWTTGRGWVRVEHLQATDNMLLWTGRKPSAHPRTSPGQESDGDSLPMTATTGRPGAGCCTEPSTPPPMGQSPTASTSITPTTTSSTITPAISSPAIQLATGPNITKSAARTGTPWADRPPGEIASLSLTSAACAETASPAAPSHPPRPAPASAGNADTEPQPQAAHTRTQCAWCAGNLSAPAATADTDSPGLVPVPVRRVSRTGVAAPVYDLTVAHDHEFIANGLLVANCLVWLEEAAAMRHLGPALVHSAFGLRIGPRPHFVASTTPKPRQELRKLIADPGTIVARGRTAEAVHLDPAVRAALMAAYGGTRLGRQELEGELLDDVEGALWTYDEIDAGRVKADEVPELVRVAVAVDPAVSVTETSDEMGLIGGGLGADGHVYVLADRSVKDAGASAARRVWQLWADIGADVVAYEDNQGKRWVHDVLLQVWRQMQRENSLPAGSPPLHGVTATVGKRLRADPVASMYEAPPQIHHVIPGPSSPRDPLELVTDQLETRHPIVLPRDAGQFERLEDQMCTWVPESGESPDRLDALVHLVTYLADRTAPANVVSPAGMTRAQFAGTGSMLGSRGMARPRGRA